MPLQRMMVLKAGGWTCRGVGGEICGRIGLASHGKLCSANSLGMAAITPRTADRALLASANPSCATFHCSDSTGKRLAVQSRRGREWAKETPLLLRARVFVPRFVNHNLLYAVSSPYEIPALIPIIQLRFVSS